MNLNRRHIAKKHLLLIRASERFKKFDALGWIKKARKMRKI